jgi:hypothetical protein
VSWLAAVAAGPTPSPKLTPGTTTPVADVLHWAQLDVLITALALLATAAQIIGVFRTLWVATAGRRGQAELARMAHESYRRQLAIMAYLGIADPVEAGREPDPPPDP